MSKKELLYYLIQNNSSMPIMQIIINMIICLLLSLFIYYIYKKTYSGVMYSKDFNITIMLIANITCMIIMIIGSNLALSLGMVGALSIIRFRTAVKDPKDIGFLFWAIGIGLATGTGIYVIGALGSVFIAIILLLLDKGIYDDSSYLLIIKGANIESGQVEDILKASLKKYKLKMKTSNGMYEETTYEIKLGSKENNDIIDQLKSVENVSSVNIISYNGEIAG